jgi:MFS family permease
MGGFWGMMPVYGSQAGLDTHSVVWLMSITIFGGAILQWPIGKISDLIDRRIVLGLSALVAAVLAYASSTYGESATPLFYMIYFLYGGFAFSLYSLSVAHINDRLSQEQSLDASQNLLQIYGIGAVAGPALAGIIMKHLGFDSLPLFFTSVLLMASLFTLYRVSTQPAPAVEYHEKFITMQRTSPVAMEMDPRNDSEPDIDESSIND